MATAESHVSAMQQQRSEHANIQSVTQLFRQRAGIDAQRTAARRKSRLAKAVNAATA